MRFKLEEVSSAFTSNWIEIGWANDNPDNASADLF